MLVEDEAGVRVLSRRILENAGYRVLEAANGDDAERVSQHADSITLLVTDIVMPGCGGPELLARLQRRSPCDKGALHSGLLRFQARATAARGSCWSLCGSEDPFVAGIARDDHSGQAWARP